MSVNEAACGVYPPCTLRSNEQKRISRPRPSYIRFGLLLPFTNPGAVMALSNLDALMPEQNRDSLQRNAFQQKLGGKRVTKSMCVAVWNLRFPSQFHDTFLPGSHCCLEFGGSVQNQ